ncbi:MAG: hypothetical protein RBR07_06445 [Arcobacteraceae bacterium]|nr:hypothetical protein [Arcobacteraceae bacterium]
MKTIILSLMSFFIFAGCSVKYDSVALNANNTIEVTKTDPKTVQNIELLSQMIQNLSPQITKEEARDVANKSIYYAMYLANSYNLVAPPSFQNFLVNQNQRERGLCHHWVSDIVSYLKTEEYPTLGIYEVVANQGSYFHEHHAISITAKGRPFDEGILLDAWRNSGTMFFSYVTKDMDYKWKERRRVR